MPLTLLALILTSVAISAIAQIALKHGMSMPLIQQAGCNGFDAMLLSALSNGYVLLGFFLYAVGAVLWLGVLARIDVGQAYPFVGLGFLLTMLFGILLLGEALSINRLLGTLLVIGGVILVARG